MEREKQPSSAFALLSLGCSQNLLFLLRSLWKALEMAKYFNRLLRDTLLHYGSREYWKSRLKWRRKTVFQYSVKSQLRLSVCWSCPIHDHFQTHGLKDPESFWRKFLTWFYVCSLVKSSECPFGWPKKERERSRWTVLLQNSLPMSLYLKGRRYSEKYSNLFLLSSTLWFLKIKGKASWA